MGSEPVCQIPLPEEDHIEEVAEIAVSTGIPTDILDVLVDALAHRIPLHGGVLLGEQPPQGVSTAGIHPQGQDEDGETEDIHGDGC